MFRPTNLSRLLIQPLIGFCLLIILTSVGLSQNFDVIYAFSISDDGELIASGHYDNYVKIWDLESGQLLSTFQMPPLFQDITSWYNIRAIAFNPLSDKLAIGYVTNRDNARIDILDSESWQIVTQFYADLSVSDILWVDNDTIAVMEFNALGEGRRHNISLWDTITGEKIVAKTVGFDSGSAMSVSSDHTKIAHADHRDLVIRDLATLEEVFRVPAFMDSGIHSISWEPNGDQIAITGKGDDMYLIDGNNGNIIDTFTKQEPTELFAIIKWNLSGDQFAVLNKDAIETSDTLEIWDASTLTRVSVEQIPTDISGFAWTPDNTIIVVGDYTFQEVTPGNLFPVASASDDQTIIAANGISAVITLDGSSSTDTDGTIVSYSWYDDDTDTEIATGITPQVTLDVGEYIVALVVTDDDGATDTDFVVITVEAAEETPIPPTPIPTTEVPPTPEPVALYRVNAGSAVAQNVNGVEWAADSYYSGGVLNDFSVNPNGPVAIDNTEDDALYQSEHSGETGNKSFTYNFPVTNGTYTVRLHFAEIWFTDLPGRAASGTGQRVFDVLIENALVLDEYDVTAVAGAPLRAQVETFANVSVTDGALTIHFPQASVDNPTIEAIEIWTTVGGGGVPTATPETPTAIPATDTPVPTTEVPPTGVPTTAVPTTPAPPTITPTSTPVPWMEEIAFSSNRNLPSGTNTGYNLYRAAREASTATVLTTLGASADNTPVWSPDRQWIVYVRDNDLWVLHVASLTTQALSTLNTSDQEINPTWSPDGDKIAFGSNRDGNHDIFVASLTLTYTGSSITVNAGTVTNLTSNGTFDDRYPVWSPVKTAGSTNYNRIAFRTDRGAGGNNEIYTLIADPMDLNFPDIAPVTATAAGVNNTQPEWGPNGLWLAFASNVNGSNLDIYAVCSTAAAHGQATGGGSPIRRT